jgi:hypothetical protein
MKGNTGKVSSIIQLEADEVFSNLVIINGHTHIVYCIIQYHSIIKQWSNIWSCVCVIPYRGDGFAYSLYAYATTPVLILCATE